MALDQPSLRIDPLRKLQNLLFREHKNDNLALWRKIENCMPFLINICPKKVADEFLIPQDATFYEDFDWNYEKVSVVQKEASRAKNKERWMQKLN